MTEFEKGQKVYHVARPDADPEVGTIVRIKDFFRAALLEMQLSQFAQREIELFPTMKTLSQQLSPQCATIGNTKKRLNNKREEMKNV